MLDPPCIWRTTIPSPPSRNPNLRTYPVMCPRIFKVAKTHTLGASEAALLLAVAFRSGKCKAVFLMNLTRLRSIIVPHLFDAISKQSFCSAIQYRGAWHNMRGKVCHKDVQRCGRKVIIMKRISAWATPQPCPNCGHLAYMGASQT